MFKNVIALNNVKLYNYDKANNTFIMVNNQVLNFNDKTFYYFKVDETHKLFRNEFDGKYILFSVYGCYPKILDNTLLTSVRSNSYVDTATHYYCHILKVSANVSNFKNGTRLHGFENNIDDTTYFDKIPLTNEMVHYDNGIIKESRIITRYKSLQTNPENWDKIHMDILEENINTREVQYLNKGGHHDKY